MPPYCYIWLILKYVELMKDNFWGIIWSSFLEVQGALITFIGIFVSIGLARFPVKSQVSLDILIIIVLILLLMIVTAVNACNRLFVEYRKLNHKLETVERENEQLNKISQKRLIPEILSARDYQINNISGIFCLLEKSELFSHNIYVSCYYTDNDDFEIIIGVGSVINIQTDGKIQVLIDEFVNNYEDILKKLANNDNKIVSRILIKPTMIKS